MKEKPKNIHKGDKIDKAFNWDTFDLDKFLDETESVGEIIHKNGEEEE